MINYYKNYIKNNKNRVNLKKINQKMIKMIIKMIQMHQLKKHNLALFKHKIKQIKNL